MERQATFSDVDEMLYNAFNTESPDGEADAEVAQATAALPELEGAAEKDDTEALRQITIFPWGKCVGFN